MTTESTTTEEIDSDPELMSKERLKTMRHLLLSLDGLDPEAQQNINNFLKFDDDIERTYLPTRKDVHLVSYLDIVGFSYFPDNQDDPFSLFARRLAKSFMALRGIKSEQFVKLMQNVPEIVDLKTSQDEGKPRGIMDRIRGRGKEE